MGLLDRLFKLNEQRQKEKHVNEVLRHADDVIDQTEKLLRNLQQSDTYPF